MYFFLRVYMGIIAHSVIEIMINSLKEKRVFCVIVNFTRLTFHNMFNVTADYFIAEFLQFFVRKYLWGAKEWCILLSLLKG